MDRDTDAALDRKVSRLIGNLTLPPTLSEVHNAMAKLPPHDGRPTWIVPRYGDPQFGLLASDLGMPPRRAVHMQFERVNTDAGPQWAYAGRVLAVPFTGEELAAMVAAREEREEGRRVASYLTLLAENMLLRTALADAGVPLPERVAEMDRWGQ